MRGVADSKALGLLTPFFLTMGILFVGPLLIIALYSILTAGPYGGVVYTLSPDSYVKILFDRDFDGQLVFNPAYIQVFARSLTYAGIASLACLLIGFPVAHYMASLPVKRRNLWIFLVTLPFWASLLIRTYAWMLILREEGLINRFLTGTGLIDAPLPLLYNGFAVVIGLIFSYLPFMILPIFASLERMDPRLLDAARDLYANKHQVLWHVILPLARAGIWGGVLLVFIPAVGSFLAADLLGGGKEMMIGNLIGLQFGFSRDWPFGSAAAVVLMAVVLAGLLLLRRVARTIKVPV